MGNDNGTWVMRGVKRDDPLCLHTAEEAMAFIDQAGFLPLFRNGIPGFSLEERTVAKDWWSGNVSVDPWEWRGVIARSGKVAYGKFFENKAGFISLEWLPVFANFRRDGYDFDALWDDGKAKRREKRIMDLFMEDNRDAELYSSEIRQKAGFGKDGEKGFDVTLNELQMMTYLTVRDFRQRKNKKGDAYGWAIGVYAAPEHLYGYDLVRSAYSEDPKESGKRIARHVIETFPGAEDLWVRRMTGVKEW